MAFKLGLVNGILKAYFMLPLCQSRGRGRLEGETAGKGTGTEIIHCRKLSLAKPKIVPGHLSASMAQNIIMLESGEGCVERVYIYIIYIIRACCFFLHI